MKYEMTTPCDACPFLKKHRKAFGRTRLMEFASGEFHCHKTGTVREDETGEEPDEFVPTKDSQHCAGMLIFLERLNQPSQMMRIAERLRIYNPRKLNMKAKV